jgi:hypothetical protein
MKMSKNGSVPRSNLSKVPRHTAFHEAGHVVADIILGVPFEYVSLKKQREEVMVIKEDEKISTYGIFNEGVVSSKEYSEKIKKEMYEGKLDLKLGIAIMAGPEAESIFIGEKNQIVIEGACLDIQQIAIHCRFALHSDIPWKEFPPSKMEDYFIEGLGTQAFELLNKNWAAVETVVNELLKRECLSYSEVKTLMNGQNPLKD